MNSYDRKTCTPKNFGKLSKWTIWDTILSKTKLRWLYGRINSALYWARVGWGTHDWDSGYGLVVLKAYMDRMDKCLSKHGHHVNIPKDIRRIREFKYILHRLIENDYDLSIYQDLPWTDEFVPDPEFPRLTQWKITAPPLKEMLFLTPMEKMRYGNGQRQQDLEFVGLYMKKYFDKWWD